MSIQIQIQITNIGDIFRELPTELLENIIEFIDLNVSNNIKHEQILLLIAIAFPHTIFKIKAKLLKYKKNTFLLIPDCIITFDDIEVPYLENLIQIYGNNNLLNWYLNRCSLKFKESNPKNKICGFKNLKNMKNIIKYVKIMINSCFTSKKLKSIRMANSRIISKLYDMDNIIPISEIINATCLKMILNIFPKSQLSEIEILSNAEKSVILGHYYINDEIILKDFEKGLHKFLNIITCKVLDLNSIKLIKLLFENDYFNINIDNMRKYSVFKSVGNHICKEKSTVEEYISCIFIDLSIKQYGACKTMNSFIINSIHMQNEKKLKFYLKFLNQFEIFNIISNNYSLHYLHADDIDFLLEFYKFDFVYLSENIEKIPLLYEAYEPYELLDYISQYII